MAKGHSTHNDASWYHSAARSTRSLLTSEHAGFSGLTHWLIAVLLFLCLWMLPTAWSQEFVASITTSGMFAFIIFMVVGGASLLPDLDSSPLQEGGSTAVYQLGVLGGVLSMVAIVISGTVWSVMHTKYDERPPSQHRMLFHAPICAVIIFTFNMFAYPASSTTPSSLGASGIPVSVWTIMVTACICIYLGGSIFFYKVLSLLGKQSMTQFFCLGFMVFGFFMMWGMEFSRLKLIGSAIALGYLFHILGDIITKGSAPFFFPIPTPTKTRKGIGWRLWWKPYPFDGRFHITTGGTLNIVLNFVLTAADIMLAWALFS